MTTEPRINREITTSPVRLIDAKGAMIGVVSIQEALRQAEQAGLDLVEISPHAEPPVCKVLDYGKFRYEAQKKANEARKKQKVIHIKEIKLRPTIDDNDFLIKMRNAKKFLAEGDKVKISLRFRGREVAHMQLGVKLMQRVEEELKDHMKIEYSPRMDTGQLMVMIVAPK